MGEKDAWQNKFIPWLQRMNLVDGAALPDIRRLVKDVADACSNPTKQYCFEKDGGLSNIQLNKRSRLRSVNILQELNAKRKNPHYKSISLRSMLYDKYDPYVFVRRAHHADLDVTEEDMSTALSYGQSRATEPLEDEKMFADKLVEPSDDGMFVEGYTYCQSPLTGSSFPSSTSSSASSLVPVVVSP
ncbi:unnamed protein product [Cylicostephanus goldi]|uniref:Uncharacterized protein n=1 Tax=Cylicostephanus goldi TaxID=71465 RepID=A0A3P7MGW1_CYLGO|nr:unnamed protein product [Cylicostephanus goldi]